MPLAPGAHIHLPHRNRQFQLVGKILNKTGVSIGLLTSESMVDMANNQLDMVNVPQPMEKMAKTYRVRTSGDGDQDPIS